MILRLVLFLVTLYTVSRVGIIHAAMFTMAQGEIPKAWSETNVLLSLWYTVPVLVIILAHEAGHYVVARRHGLRPRGPLFVPLPLSWAAAIGVPLPALGTLGAVTRTREYASPLAEWDMAAVGVWSGAIVSFWFTVAGVALSPMGTEAVMGKFWMPGPMAWIKPDVIWHPLLTASWMGWCLTAVSLLPIPKLDGWSLLWRGVEMWRIRLLPLVGTAVLAAVCWF